MLDSKVCSSVDSEARSRNPRVHPVVHGDDDHVATGCEVASVIVAGRTDSERAAVDPHHHRQVSRVPGRSDDIEGQAVLVGDAVVAHPTIRLRLRRLHRRRAPGGGLQRLIPVGGRLRTAEPEFADRWRRIGTPFQAAVVPPDTHR